MTSSFGSPGDTFYNPKTELYYVLGSDFAWRVDVSKGAGKSLHFKGVLTPPANPADEVLVPEVGDFFIYDQDGTAWNGDSVLMGNWVIYLNPGGWTNTSIRNDPGGVMSVDVSGGVLSLGGTPTDPVIDLDAGDLEAVLDDKYLRVDASNDYIGQKLNFVPPDSDDPVTLNTNGAGGLALTLSNASAFSVDPSGITAAKPVEIEGGNGVEFSGASGIKLNLAGSAWGTLASNGSAQLQWGGLGLKLEDDFDANSKKISGVLIPTEDDEPANKEYVDTEFAKLELKPATKTELGGVIVGTGLAVTVNGTISVDKTASDFVKKEGDKMTGTLESDTDTYQKFMNGSGLLMDLKRQSSTELRQRVQEDVQWKVRTYNNGSETSAIEVHSKSNGNGNPDLTLKWVIDPTGARDAVNLRTLETVADALQDQIDLINVNPDDFLPITGGIMTGTIGHSKIAAGSDTFLEIADDNGSGTVVNRFIKVKATNRVKFNFYPDQSDSGGKTAMEAAWNESTGFPEIKWNYLSDPVGNGNPVTLRYSNANYLQLSGGTLIGQLNTNSLIKSTRTSGGAFEVKPDGLSTATCLINTSGEIKLKPNLDGSSYLFSIYAKGLDSNLGKTAFRVTADGKVKAGHDSSNPFIATQDNDVVTKKKLDDAIASVNVSGGAKVRIVSSTPSDVVVGDIWLNTTDNNLYIKKS